MNVYHEIFEVLKEKGKKQKRKIIKYILFYLVYAFIIFDIILIVTDNYKTSISICFSYYLFYPICMIILENTGNLSNVMTIVFYIHLIMQIPISLGGFKGQEVIFHDYNTNKKIEYIYYGTYEGLYQFTQDNKVILISIENGYIEYTKQ